MRQSYASIRKIGAQTLRLLTIWALPNLQLLTSSKSGWRALVQVMLPSPQVTWRLRPPSLYGVSPVLYRPLYRHDLSKYLRLVQISAGAYIFTIFWGKVKNLSLLKSVLSLQRKFVHDHKSCPNDIGPSGSCDLLGQWRGVAGAQHRNPFRSVPRPSPPPA